MELPENRFDAVTALSGSGPAFFTYFLEKMVAAAVHEGMDRNNALLLAKQTMLGTSKLLIEKILILKVLLMMLLPAKARQQPV